LLFIKNIFFLNKYDILKFPKFISKNIYLYIFHLEDNNLSKKILQYISNNKNIKKIFVPNTKVQSTLLENSINENQIQLMPIPIDLEKFELNNIQDRNEILKKFNIPKGYKYIGSFQKDGTGWGDGNMPKYIKGPDILIKSLIEINKQHKIFIILSGPSRGFMINELKKNNIPYKHIYFENYSDLTLLYKVLDLYIISSRLEGGPRAVFESMASGVPLITTRVGQAADIITKKNGFMVEIDDYKSISRIACDIFNQKINLDQIIKNAKKTVSEYSYSSLNQKFLNSILND